jgi:hypothetical protein
MLMQLTLFPIVSGSILQRMPEDCGSTKMIAIAAIQLMVVAWHLNYPRLHSNLVLRQLKEKAKEQFIYILGQGSVFSLAHLIFKKIN